MSQPNQKFCCPNCHGSNVVKNGIKTIGKQNFLCRDCRKQFQDSYQYNGCKKDVKSLIMNLLVNGCGVRGISRSLSVSTGLVLKTMVRFGEKIEIKPKKNNYNRIQIDELYIFIKSKNIKMWVIYAYDPDSKEILAVTAGRRNAKQVRKLIKKLSRINVNNWSTDAWSAFVKVLPKAKHLIGKAFTKAIEGVNTALRNACRRLHRRTIYSQRR